MNETTATVIWLVAVIVMIAIAVRWFLNEKDDEYFVRNDYTIRDFYTRKRR